jgi:glutathione S-transferase
VNPILALIRPETRDAAKEAPVACPVPGATPGTTVSAGNGYGKQLGSTESSRGVKVDVSFLPKTLLTCAVSDGSVSAERPARADPAHAPLRTGVVARRFREPQAQEVAVADTALPWNDLDRLALEHIPVPADTTDGPASARSRLRLFGQDPAAVRVTLYRDHHAWCPYCQKVWLWLEERRIPYRVRKVAMVCFGEKEAWYRQMVPTGYLPALELDGRLITESDQILAELEQCFGPLGPSLQEPEVRSLRGLERELFRAWCFWLCQRPRNGAEENRLEASFSSLLVRLEDALERGDGPFLLGDFSSADLVFVPFLERMSASLAYYKGHLLRRSHPAIDRWFRALESRPSYLGTQSDFHTHAHDLPPQLGGCHASGTAVQRELAKRIDEGPWPILGEGEPDPETSQREGSDSVWLALARTVKHRRPLLRRHPCGPEGFDAPLRAALTLLATGQPCAPPAGSAPGLRHLRDRISVPRDMGLHAARQLRTALERTAALDPADASARPEPIPTGHRFDQDPRPFLQGVEPAEP